MASHRSLAQQGGVPLACLALLIMLVSRQSTAFTAVPRKSPAGVVRQGSSGTVVQLSAGVDSSFPQGVLVTAFAALLTVGQSGSARRKVRVLPLRAEPEGCEATKAEAASEEGKAKSPLSSALPEGLEEELEGQMHRFAEAGDYKSAAAARDRLSAAQLDDEIAVLQANTEFYAAFSLRHLKRMQALWLKAPFVQCIHPYDKRGTGYDAICSSFKRLFESSTKQSQISSEDIQVNVRGATATVTCTEQIVLKSVQRPVKSMVASHTFRKVSGRWFLSHRHASYGGGEWLLGQSDVEQSDALRLQQLARAAQGFGNGATKIIIQSQPAEFVEDDSDDDEAHGPYDITDEEVELMEAHNSDSAEEDEEIYAEEEEENGMDRARCTVQALRRLYRDDQITDKAKVTLIREILRNPGESMAERAHELLLRDIDHEDYEDAWEDFASVVSDEASMLARKAASKAKADEKK